MIKGDLAEANPNLARLFRCEILKSDHKAWVDHFGPKKEWDDEVKANYEKGLDGYEEINWLTWYAPHGGDLYVTLRENFIRDRLSDIERAEEYIELTKRNINEYQQKLRDKTIELEKLRGTYVEPEKYDDWKWSSTYMNH
jgi:hypothetical protein